MTLFQGIGLFMLVCFFGYMIYTQKDDLSNETKNIK